MGVEMSGRIDDTIMLSGCLAITFTMKDNLEKYRPKKQLRMLHDLFKALKRAGEFRLWCELTAQNRIHLHGLVWVHDWIKWRKHTLPYIYSKFGFYKIKDKMINDKWIEYCKKDQATMSVIFGYDPDVGIREYNYQEYTTIKPVIIEDPYKKYGEIFKWVESQVIPQEARCEEA